MPDLKNCPNCNKIFVRNLRDVCQDCYKKEEEDFQTVYQFVRKKENRMASMKEVEEGTDVKEELVVKFIKQGRLHLQSFPNLAYPCESCKRMIREGRICGECKGNITSGLSRMDSEKKFADRKRNEEKSKLTTYHSLDTKIDRKR
ncbi:hypothetical protein RJD24_19535 [Bacillaceae bacterium IKA-2]|nr:hypothetical protein RJD24_19535 [Bacillaceae bacterium IKA-2]